MESLRNVFRIILWGMFTILAASSIGRCAQAAELPTPRAAAETISQSSVRFATSSSGHCTATKIGPSRYLTAAHCARSVSSDWKLARAGKYDYQFVRSVTVPVLEKSDSRSHDWAILNTTTENEEVVAMALGCTEELYLGMPVAYYGFSSPLEVGFSVGYVASVKKAEDSRYNSDFMVDLQASPGSSGSAIVSMDTGNIIGILVEGITESRAGVFLIGVQGIKTGDLCPELEVTSESGVGLASPF